ncbi:MAG: hypothetical protein CMC04_03420 [Flavobacteriaceae bacterium]|nr:hypothetical protein [Flavobacteriaceae bacterium]
MIKFFRKIRQNLLTKNKNSEYLKYAVGEIILVVIGILIALSINNWNEERNNFQKQELLTKNIIEDLKLDFIHINKSLSEVSGQMNLIDNLISKIFDNKTRLSIESIGLIRYSSDFRPISQRNHSESVSSLEDDFVRKLLQSYFLKEDQVTDIFIEYIDIVHNKIRPYLSDVGMHNLKSLYNQDSSTQKAEVPLNPEILMEQLNNMKFQQLLYERKIKTNSFENLLNELKIQNQELIKSLSLTIN